MTIVRVKGFQIFADRHGRMRCYHRKSRIAVDLERAPLGSAEFFAECARITELTKASGPPKPGTLRLLSHRISRKSCIPRSRTTYTLRLPAVPRLPCSDLRHGAGEIRSRVGCSDQGQGNRPTRAPVWELCESSDFDCFRVGCGARLRRLQPSGKGEEYPPPERVTGSKQTLGR